MKNDNVTKQHRQSEFGDFQTPLELARKVCRWLKTQGVMPEVLVEPTCGRGNFILAALETFSTLKYVYGIEIHEPYIIQTQQKIETLCNERSTALQLERIKNCCVVLFFENLRVLRALCGEKRVLTTKDTEVTKKTRRITSD